MTLPLPAISIIMGSASDLPIMQKAAALLQEYSIDHEVLIVSAHRSPKWMVEYAENAADRGIKVIIAGAGGAAHLPGMVASLTTLPVIGVPIKSENSIDGWDSLLSIVQMPAGVPVATMAINGAYNAALLAMQILATHQPACQQYLLDIKQKNLEKVIQSNEQLNQK
ncbi:MAG: 5-(carboxyamino)imidazole ribonucleotide mutase [Chitinophagia bacterium]|nr:5-(carboxyamino)imidazole ribonucleotide mutase [Chitinophagia bacterium]